MFPAVDQVPTVFPAVDQVPTPCSLHVPDDEVFRAATVINIQCFYLSDW